jgi:hypothetical protein
MGGVFPLSGSLVAEWWVYSHDTAEAFCLCRMGGVLQNGRSNPVIPLKRLAGAEWWP